MDDRTILHHISAFAEEELALEEAHVGRPLSAEEHERLRAIEVELDQCWDLLRQRRARRSAGRDPDESAARSEGVVENYLQ